MLYPHSASPTLGDVFLVGIDIYKFLFQGISYFLYPFINIPFLKRSLDSISPILTNLGYFINLLISFPVMYLYLFFFFYFEFYKNSVFKSNRRYSLEDSFSYPHPICIRSRNIFH